MSEEYIRHERWEDQMRADDSVESLEREFAKRLPSVDRSERMSVMAKKSLYISAGVVEVYDSIATERPELRLSEAEACRALLAHATMLAALKSLAGYFQTVRAAHQATFGEESPSLTRAIRTLTEAIQKAKEEA